MIRLNLNTSPEWIEVWPGVRLEVAPLTSAIMAAANAMVEATYTPQADPSPGTEEWSKAAENSVRFVELTKAAAKVAILRWDGVGDADGNPIESPTPETIDALMDNYLICRKFGQLYMSKAFILDAEKNASSPSPAGTSAGAQTTADSATASVQSAST